MKVKILLVPLMISISIALLVWFVYPTYTNGVDGVAEKRVEAQKQQEMLDGIEQKISNVETLYASLSSQTAAQESLLKYVPESIKEEEIIDNFNYLATAEGLSVINLSVAQPQKDEIKTKTTMQGEEILPDADTIIDPITGLPVPNPNAKPKAELFDVKLSVIGEYGKIKTLLDKIYRLERFNKVESFTMKRPGASGSGDSSENTGNSLQADMVVKLGFYKKVAKITNLDNPIFSSNSFEMGVITDIKNAKSTNILKIKLDPTGKDNPFLP